MPATIKSIAEIIEKLAPLYLAFDGDNVGLLIGDEETEITKAIVALDIDNDVIDEAISKGCELIITHHPVIFHPLKTLNGAGFKQKMILRLVSSGISVYSAHTNLDAAYGGVNDYLARIIGLKDVSILGEAIKLPGFDKNDSSFKYSNLSYGRCGYLKQPVTLDGLCRKVKNVLNLQSLNVEGNMDRIVSKVGLCSGDGSDFIMDAYKQGCDVYITGDIRYHDACDAKAMGLCIIDAGHFATENIYIPEFKAYIEKMLISDGKNVNIILSEKNKAPFARF